MSLESLWSKIEIPHKTYYAMRSDDGAILYDLFLALNRRLTTILQKIAPLLTLNESHVLGEIRQQKMANSTDLIRAVNFDKTKISRIAHSFMERGWVTVQSSSKDKRVKFFSVTDKGHALVEADNQIRNTQVRECLAPLNTKEQTEITLILRAMATTYGAHAVATFPGDFPAKIEIRRLTRSMGLLGDNLFNLGMSTPECQVLHLIHRDGDTTSMATLKETLPYESSMLSRLISDLATRSLVRKVPLSFDRRHVQVSLTVKGTKTEHRHLRDGGLFILDGLREQPANTASRLISLLEKVVSSPLASPPGRNSQLRIVEINREDQRTEARAFLVERLVKTDRHHQLKDSLLPQSGIASALYNEGSIAGICDLQSQGEQWRLQSVAFAPEINDKRAMIALLMHATERCFTEKNQSELILEDNTAEQILGPLLTEPRVQGKLKIQLSDLQRIQKTLAIGALSIS